MMTVRAQLLVPSANSEKVLKALHNSAHCGDHLGAKRTAEKIMLMEAALYVIRHYVTLGPLLCLVAIFAIVLVFSCQSFYSFEPIHG